MAVPSGMPGLASAGVRAVAAASLLLAVGAVCGRTPALKLLATDSSDCPVSSSDGCICEQGASCHDVGLLTAHQQKFKMQLESDFDGSAHYDFSLTSHTLWSSSVSAIGQTTTGWQRLPNSNTSSFHTTKALFMICRGLIMMMLLQHCNQNMTSGAPHRMRRGVGQCI